MTEVGNYEKYNLRKAYRQAKRELKSNLAIAEMKEIGDSSVKLKAYRVKYKFKLVKLIVGALLTLVSMFYAPDMIEQIISKFFGGV